MTTHEHIYGDGYLWHEGGTTKLVQICKVTNCHKRKETKK